MCFFKQKQQRIRNKQRRKGKKEEKKNVGKRVVFHACRATSLYNNITQVNRALIGQSATTICPWVHAKKLS